MINYFLTWKWLVFALVTLSLWLLVCLNNLGDYIGNIRTILTVLPFLLILLASVKWALQEMRGKLAKVMAGLIAGATASTLVYYTILDKVVSWVEEKQGMLTTGTLIGIALMTLVLTVSANRRMHKASEKKARF